ncbi:hypothetical protein [Streptomyces sp. NPDC003032]
MIFKAVLDKVAEWRDRRELEQQRLQAADDFTWTWAATVDPDSYAFGAELDCRATNTLADLFRAYQFWNTADQLQEEHEHGPNCNRAEPHPAIIKEHV